MTTSRGCGFLCYNKYVLWLFFGLYFAPAQTEYSLYSLQMLKDNPADLKTVVTYMLESQGYQVLGNQLEIYNRPNLIIVIVDTSVGKKFLKLHENGGGKREYSGAQLISKHLPTIIPECLICKDNLELLVQPYVHDAQQHMLFNAVECYERAALPLVRSIIDEIAVIAQETLEYAVTPSLNDNLYINRLKTKSNDGISGRIEAFYVGKKLNLAGVEVEWKDLISKRFIIDGVEYKETLHELLECAREALNPANIRLTAICHGDFHEMNVYSKSTATSNKDFQFLDCEYSGRNDVIGDAIVTIIYQSVLTAYLGPKYHSAQFANMPGLPCAQSKFVNMVRDISVLNTEKSIMLNNVGNFGTSEVRKEMVRYFINSYLDPIMHVAQERFKIHTSELEEKIKACVLLRLIGVYNVSVMEPMDQAKILGLLFKIVATPIKSTEYVAALDRLKIFL